MAEDITQMLEKITAAVAELQQDRLKCKSKGNWRAIFTKLQAEGVAFEFNYGNESEPQWRVTDCDFSSKRKHYRVFSPNDHRDFLDDAWRREYIKKQDAGAVFEFNYGTRSCPRWVPVRPCTFKGGFQDDYREAVQTKLDIQVRYFALLKQGDSFDAIHGNSRDEIIDYVNSHAGMVIVGAIEPREILI
jgi:hypothetical protein